MLLDAVFGPQNFRNEIIWRRTTAHSSAKKFAPVHDIILYFTRSNKPIWNEPRTAYDDTYLDKYYRFDDGDGRLYWRNSLTAAGIRHGSSGKPWRGIDVTVTGQYWKFKTETLDALDAAGKIYWPPGGKGFPQIKRYRDELKGLAVGDIWTDIDRINQVAAERLGYPTQKPVALLERIIQASSNEGDIVLDAFCGCGTTVAVAHDLRRQWIGIDITYQSISLILKRLEDMFGSDVLNTIELDGIPRDIASARALAQKKDDRVRKEFEKWAILTYSNNRATINYKKGADHGIDGMAYFRVSHTRLWPIRLLTGSRGATVQKPHAEIA
jgi:adenine specific DNA methylase Mod